MPYFNAADGKYPYRPRKQADPMFRLVREAAERAAGSAAPAGSGRLALVPDLDRADEPAELEAG